MKKLWMGVAAALLASAAGWAHGPAQAVERGGRVSASFQTVTFALKAGDDYAVTCGFADFPRTALLMVTDEFRAADPAQSFTGVARYSGDGQAPRITGQVSKFRFDQYPPEDHPPYPGVFGSFGTASVDGTMTKSWAVWTVAPQSCEVKVNSTTQPLTTLDPARARVLELAEFDGGGSVQVDPLVAVGALKHQDEMSEGHLMAVFDASSATGSSAQLKVTGPRDYRYEAVSFNPFILVDAPDAAGEWSYEMTGIQSSPQFPVLWTLETPAA
jgi:hypothetical protein